MIRARRPDPVRLAAGLVVIVAGRVRGRDLDAAEVLLSVGLLLAVSPLLPARRPVQSTNHDRLLRPEVNCRGASSRWEKWPSRVTHLEAPPCHVLGQSNSAFGQRWPESMALDIRTHVRPTESNSDDGDWA
jgi:hypothetical protein